jgi:hypothetical protein
VLVQTGYRAPSARNAHLGASGALAVIVTSHRRLSAFIGGLLFLRTCGITGVA